jgi:hypothetical protein
MQALLSHLQDDMGAAMEEANKADEERKAKREKRRAEVTIGTNKISELLPNNGRRVERPGNGHLHRGG